MSYLYRRIYEDDFNAAFSDYDCENTFSEEALRALYKYLWDLAEETGNPVELDAIDLAVTFKEYASVDEFNETYGTTFMSWFDVEGFTAVLELSNGGAVALER